MDRQRLDKWLWHARVVKARTSAAALVEAGHVRINGVREKSPGHAVKEGDVVLYSKYGGTEVKYNGEEYLVLSARDLLAVISK